MTKVRKISENDLKTFRGFITHDIPASIDAKTNLLTALGLVCYTEFIGGVIRGRTGVANENRENFYEAYNAMGEYYSTFDKLLKKHFGFDFYSFFRNGMAHEYFAKGSFVIAPNSNTKKGVGFHKENTPSMANKYYYQDLLEVLDEFLAKNYE